jgi:rubrerythrin
MKKTSFLTGFIKPEWNQKRLLGCGNCGHLFMGIKLPLLTRCPKCGGMKVHEDRRASY